EPHAQLLSADAPRGPPRRHGDRQQSARPLGAPACRRAHGSTCLDGGRMIRPTTLLWMGLAGAVGFGLFKLKHEMQALEDEMFRLNRAIVGEQQSIHVLRAE